MNSASIFFWTMPEYRFMSNFYPSPILFYGDVWPTVEHAFQAFKSTDPVMREVIRMHEFPRDAKRLGRALVLRSDWETVKYSLMVELVTLKFKDEPLRSKLLETKIRAIYEDSPYDLIWGTGVKGSDGPGQNLLGKILMEVRSSISHQSR